MTSFTLCTILILFFPEILVQVMKPNKLLSFPGVLGMHFSTSWSRKYIESFSNFCWCRGIRFKYRSSYIYPEVLVISLSRSQSLEIKHDSHTKYVQCLCTHILHSSFVFCWHVKSNWFHISSLVLLTCLYFFYGPFKCIIPFVSEIWFKEP
jgi:hypothetical protein